MMKALPGIIPVLMYHTVGNREVAADAVYHLGREQFIEHMKLIRDCGVISTTIRDNAAGHADARASEQAREQSGKSNSRQVIIQFDDGAECHATTVMEALIDAGHVGEFFINPANVGRPGYADWEMLRAMHATGMSIQSHGNTHVYLDTLDDRELLDELTRSKQTIEDRIGTAVTVLAAPGGRINNHVASMARLVGYTACCGSRPGYWRTPSGVRVIPRIPIRANTSLEALAAFLKADRQAIASVQLRYHFLRSVQHILGNTNYDRLRKQVLAGESPPDSPHRARKG
jgi:peptidoglycan/xylan/chitin deacetylase (PgdA/CDA1 family)